MSSKTYRKIASSQTVYNAAGPRSGEQRRANPENRSQLRTYPVSLRRIATLFAPHFGTIVVVTLLISVSSLITMTQPFLVRTVIDDALPRHDVTLLLWLTGAMIAVAAVSSIISVIQTWLATRMGQAVMHTLRTAVFSHVQRQSLAFFTRTRGGEVQSRLTHDISGMQSVVTSTATSVASQLTTVIATVVAMLALSHQLTTLSLLVLPPAIWLSRKIALLRKDLTTQRQRALAELHSQVEESLSISGVRLSKILGISSANSQRFEESSRELVGLEIRSQLAGQWRMVTMSIIFAAIPAAIYLAAGLPVSTGSMTVGTLVAFTALQGTVFRPLMGLMNVGVQWITAMALFSRIFEYLDLKPEVEEVERPVRVDLARVKGEVCFEGVSYGYDAEHNVLSDINIRIAAGTTTALVGPTGSGKSTLGGCYRGL